MVSLYSPSRRNRICGVGNASGWNGQVRGGISPWSRLHSVSCSKANKGLSGTMLKSIHVVLENPCVVAEWVMGNGEESCLLLKCCVLCLGEQSCTNPSFATIAAGHSGTEKPKEKRCKQNPSGELVSVSGP